MPDRRVMIVLSSLLGAMTLASSLLLALEPRPQLPGTPLRLEQTVHPTDPAAALFATRTAIDGQRWTRIIIHDSGTLSGTADSLAAAHRELGVDGLGYHFILDRGDAHADGHVEIRVGQRWLDQKAGLFVNGKDRSQWETDGAIGICLIGDTDREPLDPSQQQQLFWLVRELQARFDIADDAVEVQTAGRLFPVAAMKRQLLTRRSD